MSEAPPMLGMKLACGLIAFMASSHSTMSLVSTRPAPGGPGLPGRILGDLASRGRS